jgi:hypothetical protein
MFFFQGYPGKQTVFLIRNPLPLPHPSEKSSATGASGTLRIIIKDADLIIEKILELV